jgi:hypothetical protein
VVASNSCFDASKRLFGLEKDPINKKDTFLRERFAYLIQIRLLPGHDLGIHTSRGRGI